MISKFYNKLILSSIVFGTVIGLIVFIAIFGISILNPKNIDWYVNIGGDPAQHIIGWLAYLRSDYFFPLGLTDYLLYPDKYSIMYTDSMPLLSFLLKPLYYLIGDFQYFGLYGLFNLIMQYTLSMIIIRKFTDSKIIHIFGSLLVLLSPIMYARIFGHHSLSSHWIILLALSYIIYNYEKNNFKKDLIFWSILFFIIPGIHFYFFPMVFGLFFGYIIYKYIIQKDKKIFLIILSSIIVTFISLYIIGAFYGTETSAGGGLGYFNSNLNTLFNPMHYSYFLKGLYLYSGQYEGFGYIGLGVIILIIIIIGAIIHKKNEEKLITNKLFFIISLIVFFCYIIAATGGVITLNKFELINIKLPDIFATFRATGRFIWVPVYMIIFYSLYLFAKTINSKYYVILIIVILFQIIDIKPLLLEKYNIINNAGKKELTLYTEEQCRELKDKFEYVHILSAKNIYSYPDFYVDMYNLFKCNIPINNFHFARIPVNLVIQKNNKLLKDITDEQLSDKILILTDYDMLNLYLKKYTVRDNIHYFSKQDISFMQEAPIKYIQANEKISIDSNSYFPVGWSDSEKTHRWSVNNSSIIILPIDNKGKDIKLYLTMYPYINKKLKEQSIIFKVDNNVLKEEKMNNNTSLYSIDIPNKYIVNGILKLNIVLKKPVSSPAEVGSKDKRKLGIALSEVYFEYK